MSRTCTSKRGFFTSVHPYFNHTATPYRSLFGGPDGGSASSPVPHRSVNPVSGYLPFDSGW